MSVKSGILLVIASVLATTFAASMEKDGARNLMFTFSSQDEVPAAFLAQNPEQRTQRSYRACQDGSGGNCVEAGKCPADLKSSSSNSQACGANEECCFGAPMNDNTCRSRGGECIESSQCGNAPKYRQANDCTENKVCCVFI